MSGESTSVEELAMGICASQPGFRLAFASVAAKGGGLMLAISRENGMRLFETLWSAKEATFEEALALCIQTCALRPKCFGVVAQRDDILKQTRCLGAAAFHGIAERVDFESRSFEHVARTRASAAIPPLSRFSKPYVSDGHSGHRLSNAFDGHQLFARHISPQSQSLDLFRRVCGHLCDSDPRCVAMVVVVRPDELACCGISELHDVMPTFLTSESYIRLPDAPPADGNTSLNRLVFDLALDAQRDAVEFSIPEPPVVEFPSVSIDACFAACTAHPACAGVVYRAWLEAGATGHCLGVQHSNLDAPANLAVSPSYSFRMVSNSELGLPEDAHPTDSSSTSSSSSKGGHDSGPVIGLSLGFVLLATALAAVLIKFRRVNGVAIKQSVNVEVNSAVTPWKYLMGGEPRRDTAAEEENIMNEKGGMNKSKAGGEGRP